MFNISTFSKLSNTSIQTLRYYDNLGVLKAQYVGENNYRYYTLEELMKIKVVKKLKKMGFSLKEITILLDKYDKKYFLKQKEKLQNDINDNLKSIKEIEDILNRMNNKTNLTKELAELINCREGKEINMKEKYREEKEKLLNCYDVYHNGNYEDALVLLEELRNRIIFDNEDIDDYWLNGAGDLFTGVALEIFKNNKKKDVTFLNIFYFKVNDQDFIDDLDEYIRDLEKDGYSYLCLSSIMATPLDTKDSIISTFRQKLKPYAMFDTKK